MEIRTHDADRGVLVVAHEGNLDERNADAFFEAVTQALQAGTQLVVLDCTRLRYISSYGLGTLVRVHKRLADRGGEVRLAAGGDRVVTLLHLVRLNDVFPMHPSVDAAIRAQALRPPSAP
jgi:anti-sigma B factor antagonist